MFLGDLSNRGRSELLAAFGGLIRLSNDGNDIERKLLVLEKRLKNVSRKVR